MHLVLVNRLGSLPWNSVIRLTDRRDMTIVVDWDVKPQIKQNKKLLTFFEMTPKVFAEYLRDISWRNSDEISREFLRENSRRKKWSARKFAFENFCSSSEREKRAFFSWADLYMHKWVQVQMSIHLSLI